MVRRCCLLLCILALMMLASCQKAQQYRVTPKRPAIEGDAKKDDDADQGLPALSWVEPKERRDLPIVFIADNADNHAEWKSLKSFWNEPPLFAGMATVHIGLDPLPALAAMILTEQHFAIKIKVPRGLPDPTPHFPPSNPPSYGKWTLGKALFHDRLLRIGADFRSCASCHDPERNFSDGIHRRLDADYNTLSLVNAVYNRRQFWDGRVRTLEETLGSFPIKPAPRTQVEQHNWGGFVRDLAANKQYVTQFNLVFGVEYPTQDTVAQALATYIRTILSGDSLYDRADLAGRDKQAKALPANHFLDLLKDEAIRDSIRTDPLQTPEQMSAMLVKGYELFHGKARCAQCHSGPLFTDGDYHNVGLEAPAFGMESGRALHVPVGLKEARLIGAYRTPSLRNLVLTGPYFHDGSQLTLRTVLDYYDSSVIDAPGRLAKPLLDGSRPMRLHLLADEKESLLMFLHALQGTPVDSKVSGLAK